MKGVVPRVMYLAPLAGCTLSIYDALSARIIAKKQVCAHPITASCRKPLSIYQNNAFTLRNQLCFVPDAEVC